ncbi:MAG: ABC transporter permease subunit/CPBP intramembrane protease [Isosphaeraceae bacterium]
MRWRIVWTIFRRELLDQLRDRRTLFMVLVLPVLLYPMLGLGMFKAAEMLSDKPDIVVVLGAENLPDSPPYPPLLDESRAHFDKDLFENPANASRFEVKLASPGSPWENPEARRELLRQRQASVVLVVPPDLTERLARSSSDVIAIAYNGASEPSQNAFLRVDRLISRWGKAVGNQRLAKEDKPEDFAEPIRTRPDDVATVQESGATVWARLFPFLLVMMSLTGAFYPAIDLCAGEKERGTMETLLLSPASRGEIVLGKYFTVLLASVMTALLNLASMGLTGMRLAPAMAVIPGASARAGIQPPSLASGFWMILLLVPLAAFFSAVSVAMAVLARSMKEGQYYLTPVYLVTMPLVMMTLIPGIELSPSYSMVPITGVALLLRALMLGEYTQAARYFVPVVVPTLAYGALALRWAVDQFQSESVLFREAERFHPRDYARHLIRDRGPLPSSGAALFGFALMISAAWFLSQWLGANPIGVVLGQLGFVLVPTLLLTFLLSSSPSRTLRLKAPRWTDLAIAAGLVLCLNPLQMQLSFWVMKYFPMSGAMQEALKAATGTMSWPVALVVVALIPAVCEELAFRGFILSGLESGHSQRSAIVISALLFGFMHLMVSLYQQLFNTTLLGLILGLLAVRTRSLLPGILMHFINNGLGVALDFLSKTPRVLDSLGWLYRDKEHLLYHWHWMALGAVGTAALLGLLFRRPAVPAAWPIRGEIRDALA